MKTKLSVIALLLSSMLLAACIGETSSNGCGTTTATDSNGNPINTVVCD